MPAQTPAIKSSNIFMIALLWTDILKTIVTNLQSFRPSTFSFIFTYSYRKTVIVVRKIQTRIVGVEGQDANHLTTTTGYAVVVVATVAVLLLLLVH